MTHHLRDFTIQFPDNPKKHIVHGLVCESMTALADLIHANRNAWPYMDPHARQRLHTGAASNVAASDKLLDQFETADLLTATQSTSVRAIAGGVADVPAFLSGSPVAMRRRVKRETFGPVTIVCDVGTSAAISADTIQRRGVAVLALVRKLVSAGFPVNLYLGIVCREGSAQNASAIAVKVDTAPLDLARACWGLSDADYQRKLMFQTVAGIAGKRDNEGTLWPFGGHNEWIAKPERQTQTYATLLGVEPSGLLVIPPVFAAEAEHFKTEASTLAWVQDRYADTVRQATAYADAA